MHLDKFPDCHFLFDTCIVNNVFKKSENFVSFCKSYSEINPYGNPYPYIISTPLMLFEYLGYSLKHFDLVEYKKIELRIEEILKSMSPDTINVSLNEIVSIMLEWFANQDELNLTKVIGKYEKQKNYLDKEARIVFETIVRGHLNKYGVESLIMSLTYDRILAIPYAKIVEKKETLEEFNKIFFEHIKEFYDKSRKSHIRIFSQDLFSNKRELLDTEIISFILFGNISREFGKTFRTIVFTNENIDKWKERLKISIKKFTEALNSSGETIHFFPGGIFQLESNGIISESSFLDVRNFL